MKWIHEQKVEPPKKSLFSFELNKEAALKNSLVLKKFDYDLKKAIEAQPETIISYGSEIRPFTQLDVLLHNHRYYSRFRANTLNGISYPIDDIDEETRKRLIHE